MNTNEQANTAGVDMTAELVERLREEASYGGEEANLLNEAADTIAAQAAENARLKVDGIHSCNDECQRPMCVLRRENARQAAELEGVRKAAVEAVPTNWLDPLLTSKKSALHGPAGTWGCPDIERLLKGVKARIDTAIADSGAGGGA